MAKIQPLGDRVLVQAIEVKEEMRGGLYIPDAAKEKPMQAKVIALGTGKIDDNRISEAVHAVFDFRPAAIIDTLQLRRPIYRPLAAYGHIGREDLDVVWEKTDKVDALRKAAGI